jgi:AcrR family transcriptional regulator
MPQRTRAVRSDGARSRAAILEAATQLSSVTGLEGLSIGALADAAGMSKGGLYAHFDSKQDLQLSVIDAARKIFIREVVAPALRVEDPLDRLRALAHGFLRYVEQRVFPGGCFFVSAAAEFGSRRGPVHDQIAAAQREWTSLLRTVAEQAIAAGCLPPSADADQLAFQLAALLAGANLTYVLHDDRALLDRAYGAVDALVPRD